VVGDLRKYRRSALAAFACLFLGVASAPADARSTMRWATTPDRLLAAHNMERAMARVPPMRWSSSLAAQATQYARWLAATGRFQHSNRGSRGGTGENLWMGTSGAFSIEQMISGWTSERRWFKPGTFPYVSRTRSWHDVGHYTQMIWPSTTTVGCGIASARGNDVLVCHYGPAGNVMGRRVGGWSYAAR
jgi:hypothetical protein